MADINSTYGNLAAGAGTLATRMENDVNTIKSSTDPKEVAKMQADLQVVEQLMTANNNATDAAYGVNKALLAKRQPDQV